MSNAPTMNSKGHFWISIAKSLIRIVGCYMGVHGNLHGMAMSFIFAEAMGILEELADER